MLVDTCTMVTMRCVKNTFTWNQRNFKQRLDYFVINEKYIKMDKLRL